VVEGERIREVSARPIKVSATLTLDAGGRTLMPGLIDCHVHVFLSEMNIRALEGIPLTLMTARGAALMLAMLSTAASRPWHIDGSFDGPDGSYWVNVHSKMRGLLVLFLLTDVDELSAPTRILKGSHLDAPRVLLPLGEDGIGFSHVAPRLPTSTFERQQVLAVGNAGDVYVCHPFLVHAASWPHRGMQARMIAQPGVATLEPFALSDHAAEADVCPVEAAILRGLRDT
jgi:hypothetical protein